MVVLEDSYRIARADRVQLLIRREYPLCDLQLLQVPSNLLRALVILLLKAGHPVKFQVVEYLLLKIRLRLLRRVKRLVGPIG